MAAAKMWFDLIRGRKPGPKDSEGEEENANAQRKTALTGGFRHFRCEETAAILSLVDPK